MALWKKSGNCPDSFFRSSPIQAEIEAGRYPVMKIYIAFQEPAPKESRTRLKFEVTFSAFYF